MLKRFISEETGVTAVEYAFLVGLIALVSFNILRWMAMRFQLTMYTIFYSYLWW